MKNKETDIQRAKKELIRSLSKTGRSFLSSSTRIGSYWILPNGEVIKVRPHEPSAKQTLDRFQRKYGVPHYWENVLSGNLTPEVNLPMPRAWGIYDANRNRTA
ncbi:hypothetical protein HYT23_00590 [Candidatus Pacearchaeota archaeon]|nr:hypothetical protein [Candidatus Pacearchaeota archaeon]